MRLPATITATEPIEGLTPSRIDPENLGLAMEFLTAVYSRPRDAVLRELAANGVDAQKSAGYDGPVEITLPSDESAQLVVADHGTGMSQELMTTVFADFLESTKRESDSAIGGFGVGGKTPVAVTDQFVATSTHEGTMVSMLLAKQPDGTIGHKVLSRQKTNAASGTTITVPLAEADIQEWKQAAERVFFWWDEDAVLVNGQAPRTYRPEMRKNVSTAELSFLDRTGFGTPETHVRINGVGYQVPRSMAQDADVRYAGLVFEVGDASALTISRSRETIDHTDAGVNWLREANRRWMKTITRRARTWLNKAETSVEVAKVWQRVPDTLASEVLGTYRLRSLLTEKELPVHLENRATIYFPGKRNRLTDEKLFQRRGGFFYLDSDAYVRVGQGLFITPQEFTDEVGKIISRWRKGPGKHQALTVVDPATPKFEKFIDPDAVTWITGAEIIEQAPPAEPKRRTSDAPFSIERLQFDLRPRWMGAHRGSWLSLEQLQAFAREGYNLVAGNLADVNTMRRSLDQETDIALMRGSRSLERLQELVGAPVYTPEQMIAKHADDGLYQMSPKQRQSIADLHALDLSWQVKSSIVGLEENPELSAAARKIIVPWAKHLRGPERNRVDYKAATKLPKATVTERYPLTAKMLKTTERIDVAVLNALVELDLKG